MLSQYDALRAKFIYISAPEVESAVEFKSIKKMLLLLDTIIKVERNKKEKLLIIKHNRKYGRTADVEANILDALARNGYSACKVENPEVAQAPSVELCSSSSSSSSRPSSSYRF